MKQLALGAEEITSRLIYPRERHKTIGLPTLFPSELKHQIVFELDVLHQNLPWKWQKTKHTIRNLPFRDLMENFTSDGKQSRRVETSHANCVRIETVFPSVSRFNSRTAGRLSPLRHRLKHASSMTKAVEMGLCETDLHERNTNLHSTKWSN